MAKPPVESVAPFKWVGGRLCLDFVNTVGGRLHGGPAGAGAAYRVRADKLGRLDDLGAWERGAGPPSAPRTSARASAAGVGGLARAVALREALYRLFRAKIRGEPLVNRDLDLLSAELAAARRGQRLVVCGDRIELRGAGAARFPGPLLGRIAESAVELLTGEDAPRIRQCPGEDCGWLFVDDSRSGRRRWCDMKDCGNRAKVDRFRRRQKPARQPRDLGRRTESGQGERPANQR